MRKEEIEEVIHHPTEERGSPDEFINDIKNGTIFIVTSTNSLSFDFNGCICSDDPDSTHQVDSYSKVATLEEVDTFWLNDSTAYAWSDDEETFWTLSIITKK